jgi:hypothetical protein
MNYVDLLTWLWPNGLHLDVGPILEVCQSMAHESVFIVYIL